VFLPPFLALKKKKKKKSRGRVSASFTEWL